MSDPSLLVLSNALGRHRMDFKLLLAED